jgi:hypothetical protein
MRSLLLLILLCLTINASAQEDRIRAGEALQVTIEADAPTMRFYEGHAGETIQISAQALETGETTPDLVLWLVFDGQVLAYNNNQGESPNPNLSHYLTTDGLYSIYVDSFNGVSEGTAELLLEQVDPFHMEMTMNGETSRLLIDLPAGQVFRHNFGASGGILISVKDLSGNLDPYIRLLTGDGAVAENDDHARNDFLLGLFDSRLEINVSTGVYILEVRDFLGNAGQVEILVTP